MNRRVFLGAVGSAASAGALAFSNRESTETLDVRFWLSARASEYDGVPARIEAYLRHALSIGLWDVEVDYGGTVQVSTEDGAAVTRRGEWPRLLGTGLLERNTLDVARDVNLLVTDGQMQTTPTGYGVPHVASVGGAAAIAAIDPVDPDRLTYEYTTPNRVMQVLIHEVGHTLGLHHDHGIAYERDDAVVVTPMLSTYAFDPEHETDSSRCGESHEHTAVDEPTAAQERRFQLTYSACARERLASYRGGTLSLFR